MFRIAFGVVLVWLASEYLAGRLERLYVSPRMHFSYPGFEWIPAGSAVALRWLVRGLLVAGLLVTSGLLYRLACLYWCLAYGYLLLQDAANYNNHSYLICLLAAVMAAVPADRALRVFPRAASGPAGIPTWALWLVRFQVAVPYVFGGLAKLNRDWLVAAQPMRLWLTGGTEGTLRLDLLHEPWIAWAMSWSGALLDLLAVPALLWRRTRIAALAALAGFHLINRQLFSIDVFPWLMLAASSIFFPPDWPRRLGLMPASVAGRQAPPRPAMGRRRTTLAALAAWALFQTAVPFRHLLDRGPVDWTELGHRFSWRMKLRDKRGTIRFVAYDPRTGARRPLDDLAHRWVTDFQWAMMLHDPDMIRQVAGVLGGLLEREGTLGLEVRVESNISFNGRPPQTLVEPTADLSRITRDAGSSWISALRTESP